MKLLLPIILALAGTGAGVGAGIALKGKEKSPVASKVSIADKGSQHPETSDTPKNDSDPGNREYVKLNNQFVVPVVENGRVSSLVVLSLNLEVLTGNKEKVFEREPKIRDALNQVLFDHANIGGFSGAFTNSSKLDALRASLLIVARKTMGPVITDVLIIDVIRQDI